MGKTIKKVSFKSAGQAGVKIGYDNFDDNGSLGDTSKNYKNVPHETFNEALQRLKVHALFITEFLDVEKFKKIPLLDVDDVLAKDFRVCGVHVSGEGEKEGIVITCYRTLKTGHGYVFNTPNVRVENEGDTAYKFIGELLSDIESVKAQADEYLRGKYGVKQGELFEKVSEEVGQED